MILHGNPRGGASNLAHHLLKEENDHVTVHELRGFIADDLEPALNEIYAVSRGTKAQKFMFSMSLNPPADKDVSTDDFMSAIHNVETEFGFEKQPRAIVFHEKNARRHCHVVWSRIDTQTMKAIPLPYHKNRLMDHSRELYIKHGWQMPKGMIQSKERDPTNFTMAEWQQAKRVGKDPKNIKTAIQDCWGVSDNQTSFQKALASRGYTLAKGEKRIVALDHHCEIYAISKYAGIRREKTVRDKVNEPDTLPSVEQAKAQIAAHMQARLVTLQKQQNSVIQTRLDEIEAKRKTLVKQQKAERQRLANQHAARAIEATQARQGRYNKGLRGLVDRFTGKHKAIRAQNERETLEAQKRDQRERDKQIAAQMHERRQLEARKHRLDQFRETKAQTLSRDIQQFREIQQQKRDKPKFERNFER